MIKLIADNKPIDVKWIEFSDGALTCKVDPFIKDCKFTYISFTVDPSTPVKQVQEEVYLLINALENLRTSSDKKYLNLPYLPYGRADRVFEEGNPSPLGVFAYNTLEHFDRVYLNDIHNEDILTWWSLITSVNHNDQLQCFKETIPRKRDYVWDYVIAPDKGAKDKAKRIANHLKVPVVTADKRRDISTGRIRETTLEKEFPAGSHVIICDDILDGGGTFIPLAEKLRSQGCTVDLYITHLIAAKGLDLFKGLIDNIYCWHTVGKHINKQNVTDFNQGK